MIGDPIRAWQWLFVPLLLTATAHAAEAPAIPAQAATVDGFAPAGWVVLKKAMGDLNGDGRADAALVIESRKQHAPVFDSEASRADFSPRVLVVALAMVEPPGYRRLLTNSDFIEPHTEPRSTTPKSASISSATAPASLPATKPTISH
jgi:hypothetical protein